MESDEIVKLAKSEASRWRALADDVETELAAVTGASYADAHRRHNLRVRHAELLLCVDQQEVLLADLDGQ